MPHQVTVTAPTGPNKTVTGLVLSATDVVLELNKKILRVKTDDGNTKEFDISASTTITVTITSGNYAVVVT